MDHLIFIGYNSFTESGCLQQYSKNNRTFRMALATVPGQKFTVSVNTKYNRTFNLWLKFKCNDEHDEIHTNIFNTIYMYINYNTSLCSL